MNALETKAIIAVVCSLILGISPPAWAGLFDIETKLTASDAALCDLFGVGVAISGGTAIVGARWDDGTGDAAGAASDGYAETAAPRGSLQVPRQNC